MGLAGLFGISYEVLDQEFLDHPQLKHLLLLVQNYQLQQQEHCALGAWWKLAPAVVAPAAAAG